jgi:hypothetical protein
MDHPDKKIVHILYGILVQLQQREEAENNMIRK